MKNKFTEEDQKIFSKLMRLCSRVEKCRFDIQQYFIRHQLPLDHFDTIADRLTDEDFIDEYRFAQAFVNDKFILNGWGKMKIANALWQKQISETLIRQAIRKKIDDKDYLKLLQNTLIKKKKSLSGLKIQELKQKLTNFAIIKGFEPELVYELVSKIEA